MKHIVVNRTHNWIRISNGKRTYYFHSTVKRILFFLRHPKNGIDFTLEIHHG